MSGWDVRLALRRLLVSPGYTALLIGIIGAVAGLGVAVRLTRVLRTLLFGVSPTDPLSFGAVGMFLLLVAALACWVPARTATRANPAGALRVE